MFDIVPLEILNQGSEYISPHFAVARTASGQFSKTQGLMLDPRSQGQMLDSRTDA